MNVLVDTSVWSLALRRSQKIDGRFEHELGELIRDGRVEMSGPIRQELLSGVKQIKEFQRLRDELRAFPDVELPPRDFEEAVRRSNFPTLMVASSNALLRVGDLLRGDNAGDAQHDGFHRGVRREFVKRPRECRRRSLRALISARLAFLILSRNDDRIRSPRVNHCRRRPAKRQ
ncbi:MAG: hypothetical protein ACREV9_01550 [Burkholderiales bacterium]